MDKKYSSCQSCGMPFKNDPKGGGSNSDGSLSTKYCSLCYENGKFLQPDITVKEMQQLVKEKLKTMGIFHRLFAGVFAGGISKLERWNKEPKENRSPVK